MRQRFGLAIRLPLLAACFAASSAAAGAWDHRGMQSHYQATEPAEQLLAPGEQRIGRIIVGAPAPSRAAVPDTLEHTTQRQWQQRGSFGAARQPVAAAGAPGSEPRDSHSGGGASSAGRRTSHGR